MASNSNTAIFVALVAFLVIISSTSAATTHQVGDGLGWNIPPGGAIAYSTWSLNNTFNAGDALVFTFLSGSAHDVAEVTKEAFDACNASNPISVATKSPASFTVTSGEHYYICTFSGHCEAGQKLAVNVTGTTSTSPYPAPTMSPSYPPTPILAPEPSSGASPPALAPSPSSGSTTYIVGDVAGWNVLGNGSYSLWASNKTFLVGDVLMFNFLDQTHDVAEVTKTSYETCDTSNTLSLYSNPPVRITLDRTGEKFFLCTFSGHCNQGGQKLAINVTSSIATTPTSAPSPSPISESPTPTPSPSIAAPPSKSTTAPGPTSDAPPSPKAAATSRGVAAFAPPSWQLV